MRLLLKHIEERAEHRPPGYKEECLAAGTIDGEWLELTDEAYKLLCDKYGNGEEEPGFYEMLRNFKSATARWAAAGFPIVEHHTWSFRIGVCRACPHWSGIRCARCGCFRVKLWLATEKCPMGKWF